MDNKEYAFLADKANQENKILKIDGENYWLEDPPTIEVEEQEAQPTFDDRIAALEDGMLAMMLGGASV